VAGGSDANGTLDPYNVIEFGTIEIRVRHISAREVSAG
jgi:hypothetical protein